MTRRQHDFCITSNFMNRNRYRTRFFLFKVLKKFPFAGFLRRVYYSRHMVNCRPKSQRIFPHKLNVNNVTIPIFLTLLLHTIRNYFVLNVHWPYFTVRSHDRADEKRKGA